MKKVFITGSTGNVGFEVIKFLKKIDSKLEIIAGVWDLEKDNAKLAGYNITLRKFDFTDSSTYEPALNDCEILFLLRPPQISEVEKYFNPLIALVKKVGIKHIVFLSVQGVEKSKIIPHHKIEKLIRECNIPFTFLRPAYFMQNFTSTLHNDLALKKRIFLPAGNSKFTLVDVRDLGDVAANIVNNTESHINKAYELTCNEKLNFKEMATKLSEGLGIKINYISPNLIKFFLEKRKEKIPSGLILVMIMLHYLPRFQKEPIVTEWVMNITGHQPIPFEQFIKDNKALMI